MKILVTAIQKGGQGKTFITCHLALDFFERNLRVAVIDLDTQGNASLTLARFEGGYPSAGFFMDREEELKDFLHSHVPVGPKGAPPKGALVLFPSHGALADLERLPLQEACVKLRRNLDVLRPFFDLCLIDTPPSLGVMMISSLLCGDFLLIPMEPEAYSLQGVGKMLTVLAHLQEKNPGLVLLGLFANKLDQRKPRQLANMRLVEEKWPGLLIAHSIGAREAIARACEEAVPVWEIRRTAAHKASTEVRALAGFVFRKIMDSG